MFAFAAFPRLSVKALNNNDENKRKGVAFLIRH